MERNTNNSGKPRPTREAFYVRVGTGDGAAAFINATEHVGRTMPFSKPRATLAMQVTDQAIAFSLLHLTKNNAARIAERPIEMPRGPLTRLGRRAVGHHELGDSDVIVEVSTRVPGPATTKAPTDEAPAGDVGTDAAEKNSEAAATAPDLATNPGTTDGTSPAAAKRRGPRPATIETWNYTITRDGNGVGYLEPAGDEHTLELPRGAMHISIYLRSPAVGRVIAIGFIGHVGKPGSTDNLGRIAAMVLNSMSHLPEFRALSRIETMNVPAPPRGLAAPVRAVPVGLRAAFTTQVYLFGTDLSPIGNGAVEVAFDLENANPSSGKLLTVVTPEDTIAEAFAHYKGVFDLALEQAILTTIGKEDATEITYDIILGSVTESTVERLVEVGESLKAVDLSLDAFRAHV